MATNRSVSGSNRLPEPLEPHTKKKNRPLNRDYGIRFTKAMAVAKMGLKACMDETGLKPSTIKKARAGQHIHLKTHERLLEAIVLALPPDKRHLGNIRYPWATKSSKQEAPAKATSVVLNIPSYVLVAQRMMPQAGHGKELDLKGGRLQSLKCTIETSSPYFRFGLKLMPEGADIHGEVAIQTKHDFLLHIGRNEENRKGVAASGELFATYYRRGVKEGGEDERLFRTKPNLKAKLEFTIHSGSITLSVDGRARYETIVEAELCNHAALFAWNDHKGMLKVIVKDIVATVIKPA